MTITLTAAQLAWLEGHVAAGDFASVEEGVRQLLDERIVDETCDLAWAKPDVDEARAGVARGEYVTFEEYRAETAGLLASLES